MYGRFPILTDEHVSSALVKALRRAGWTVHRVEDEPGLGKRALDSTIFAHAAERGWVWLSRDQRALRHPKQWLEQRRPFRGMLSWSQERLMPIGEVMRFLEALALEEVPFAAGVRHVKPRP